MRGASGKRVNIPGCGEHLAQPAVAVLIGPRDVPVRTLIPDEEQTVQRGNEAHEQERPPENHGAMIVLCQAEVRGTARRCRRPGDRVGTGRRPLVVRVRPCARRSPRRAAATSHADASARASPGGASRAAGIAFDDVAHAADVGADARHTSGERFDERDRRAFVARGQQEHVGRAVDGRQVAAPAKKTRAVGDAVRACQLFELAAPLAVADDQEQRRADRRRRPAARLPGTARDA